MSTFKDPSRLFESEEAPRKLRLWLDRAHHDAPSAAEVKQIIRTVEALASAAAGVGPATRLGAPGAGGGGAPISLAGFRPLSAKTAMITLSAVGAGLALAVLVARHDSRSLSGSPRGRPDSVVSVASDTVEKPSVPQSLSNRAAANPAEEPTPREVRAQESPRPARASGVKSTSRAAARRDKPEPTASTTPEPAPSAASAAPKAAAPNTEEYRLLREARRALSTDPARALALAEEHASRFSGGMLGQEREAIAIEALSRLGRTGQASSRAQAFLRRFPNSPYRNRIERAVPHANAGAAP
jgi:hypothetical protein